MLGLLNHKTGKCLESFCGDTNDRNLNRRDEAFASALALSENWKFLL